MAPAVVRPTWARLPPTEQAQPRVLPCGSCTVPRPSWPELTKVAASRTRSWSVALSESLNARALDPRTSESQDCSLPLNGSRQEAGRRTRVRRPRETNGHPRAGSPLMDRSWRACPTATSRFTLGNSQVSRSDGTPFAGCHLLACAATCVVCTPFAIGHPKGSSFAYAHSPSGLSVPAHQLLPPESGASTAPDVPRRGPSLFSALSASGAIFVFPQPPVGSTHGPQVGESSGRAARV